jgi:hypothetical protein
MNFITGNKYKKYAHYIFDESGFHSNQQCASKILTFFIKTDYIKSFFDHFKIPNNPFIIITHNSDYAIDNHCKKYLEYPNLIKWYAQNVDYEHINLIPIPIGIANEQWSHGNATTLSNIINKQLNKKKLIYANFNIYTNIKQRQNCMQNIQKHKSISIEHNVSFETYLTHTAESYFSICPLGNGIDSHRIWESLYLKTIPITENTYNINYLQNKFNLPIIFINEWEEINNITLTEKIYYDTIKLFDPSILNVETFMI